MAFFSRISSLALLLMLQGCTAIGGEGVQANEDHNVSKAGLSAEADDSELAQLNQCLARYTVTMLRGDDGKYRIWGDINRIQDIVDGPCLSLFPRKARADLDGFFAREVDPLIAACFRAAGYDAVIDPATGPGIELKGDPPPDDLFERCFLDAYADFATPPGTRPETS